MSWLETLRTGLNGIRSHRLRSGLTVLGILIGIAAVILTVGLGEGAQAQVSSDITALGTNLLTVSPGSSTSVVRHTWRIRNRFHSDHLRRQRTGLARPWRPTSRRWPPSPTPRRPSRRGPATGRPRSSVRRPRGLPCAGKPSRKGRFIDNQDVSDHEPVVVLGSVTASELFSREDPVGQTVDVDGLPLTVVGVLNSVGSSTSSSTTSDPDDTAIVPITTAAQRDIRRDLP